MATVTSSNGRFLYIRHVACRSGNSAVHGAHHVAQKLISRVLPLSAFLTSASRPAASTVVTVTGSLLMASYSALVSAVFSSHLIEQPTVGVFSTGTVPPASTASSASRASATLAYTSRGLLSMRPW